MSQETSAGSLTALQARVAVIVSLPRTVQQILNYSIRTMVLCLLSQPLPIQVSIHHVGATDMSGGTCCHWKTTSQGLWGNFWWTSLQEKRDLQVPLSCINRPCIMPAKLHASTTRSSLWHLFCYSDEPIDHLHTLHDLPQVRLLTLTRISATRVSSLMHTGIFRSHFDVKVS